MIPKDKIIDNCENKLKNKIRDDSFIKFCNENNCTDIIENEYTDDDGIKTVSKIKIDSVTAVRNYRGELMGWETRYINVK
mgnify:CR=1 FL=1